MTPPPAIPAPSQMLNISIKDQPLKPSGYTSGRNFVLMSPWTKRGWMITSRSNAILWATPGSTVIFRHLILLMNAEITKGTWNRMDMLYRDIWSGVWSRWTTQSTLIVMKDPDAKCMDKCYFTVLHCHSAWNLQLHTTNIQVVHIAKLQNS